MKTIVWIAAALFSTLGAAQSRHTVATSPGDAPATVVRRAAHVVPSARQLTAMQDEFIAFVHFGPNTFTRREWGTGKEDPAVFALKSLDTDQWCAAMKAAGMKKVIITAKHHDGFVLWQSRYTTHGVMSSPFRNGKGDVVADLAASCRKYGLKLGIYLSPADLYQMEAPDGLYGNGSPSTLRTIPRTVAGRPFRDRHRFRFVVDDYNEYFLNQLFELLTEYGPIDEVWFDGAHPRRKGGQRYNYNAWRKLIRTLAPKAVIFGREDVRWCGNEAGGTRTTEWNVVPYAANPDTMTVFADLTADDLGSRARLTPGVYLHYQPAETNTSIREGWFYRDDDRQQVRSADDVFDIYERAVGGNSIFLLNIPPNRDGRFSPADVATLEETGRRIRDTYGHNLIAGKTIPAALLDHNLRTAVGIDTLHPELIVRLDAPVTVNRFMVQENVATAGERVEAFALDVMTPAGWREISRSTNIGYKRILRFPDVTTAAFRLRFFSWRDVPQIAEVGAYRYAAHPPRLEAVRTPDGRVTLRPQRQTFGWKTSTDDPTSNLLAGLRITYTTDGTVPTPQSAHYVGPFMADDVTLKAVGRLGDEAGPVLTVRYGKVKRGWRIVGAGSGDKDHPATAAIDDRADTYWQSADVDSAALTIDLGTETRLTAFAYTPPRRTGKGLIESGTVLVSADGRQWQRAVDFELGNLINDPTRRIVDFPAPVRGRYLRLVPTRIAGGGNTVGVAEIDVFGK